MAQTNRLEQLMEIEKRAQGTLSGFKQFILRGNVVDLAVGVVFGAAFSGLVNSIVKDLITPLIAAIFTQPDFSQIHVTMLDPTLGAIIASGFAAVLVGMIWYHPRIFGGAWMRLAGLTPEMQEQRKKRMPVTGLLGFLAAMLVAYVMSYVSAAWGFYS